mgnify:CR=1 FL=1
MTDANVAKRAAAYAAADLVEDGMTIGLGSGSTFLFMADYSGRRGDRTTEQQTGKGNEP